jgi:hypothetical protein
VTITRRIGIGAGVLLLCVIIAAITPPLIVQYRLHAFLGRLHAGMSRGDVNAAAAAVGLAASSQAGTTMDFEIPAPWTVATQCHDDYAIVVVMSAARARSWATVKNRVCT